MDFLLALWISTQNLCSRHLIGGDNYTYMDMNNLELVLSHQANPNDLNQQELRYRLKVGLITPQELLNIKAEASKYRR